MKRTQMSAGEMRSPFLALLNVLMDATRGQSARKRGYAIDDVVKGAIQGGVKFRVDDFERADGDDDDGINLVSWLGRNGSDEARKRHEESWYAVAVAVGNVSAMTALERWRGFPRLTFDGTVLKPGTQWQWPPARREGNPAGWCTVRGYLRDGEAISVEVQGDTTGDSSQCEACGRWRRPERAKPTTLRIARVDIERLDRALRKLRAMAFEVDDPDGGLREYEGKSLDGFSAENVMALAALEVGAAAVVHDKTAMRRIACRTHDILAAVAYSEEHGNQHWASTLTGIRVPYCQDKPQREVLVAISRPDGYRDYSHVAVNGSDFSALAEQGLLTETIDARPMWRPEGDTDRYYRITDAGRARLTLLDAPITRDRARWEAEDRARCEQYAAEDAARRAAEAARTPEERAAEQAARRQAARVALIARLQLTDADMARVVTRDDSIDTHSGNCARGTDLWIARNCPGRTSMTVAELLDLMHASDEHNIANLLRAARIRWKREERQIRKRASA